MDKSKIERDRGILFPRATGAVLAIENKDIDIRYEIIVVQI